MLVALWLWFEDRHGWRPPPNSLHLILSASHCHIFCTAALWEFVWGPHTFTWFAHYIPHSINYFITPTYYPCKKFCNLPPLPSDFTKILWIIRQKPAYAGLSHQFGEGVIALQFELFNLRYTHQLLSYKPFDYSWPTTPIPARLVKRDLQEGKSVKVCGDTPLPGSIDMLHLSLIHRSTVSENKTYILFQLISYFIQLPRIGVIQSFAESSRIQDDLDNYRIYIVNGDKK